MLNTFKSHPAELMPISGMTKDLITKYLEPATANAKGHMMRVQKTYSLDTQHPTGHPISTQKEGKKWHQFKKCTAPLKTKCAVS